MKIGEEITKILVDREIVEIKRKPESLTLTFDSPLGHFDYTISLNKIEYEKLSEFKNKNIVKEIEISTFEDLNNSFYENYPYLRTYENTKTVLFRLLSKTGIQGIVVAKAMSYTAERSEKGAKLLQKGMDELVKERLAEDPNYIKDQKYFEITDENGNKLPFPEGLDF